MLYTRIIEKDIKEHLFKNQVLVIYGLRQVGKTTLVKKIFDHFDGEKIFFRGDIPSERDIFREPEPSKIIRSIGNATLVIIDEAQMIENIGSMLKVMIDVYPHIQFIVTGSSSFDLANKIREPLTGRAREYMLYPLSYEEVVSVHGLVYMNQQESFFMRYGWYPRISLLSIPEAQDQLSLLQNNTLYKDIFILDNIRKPLVLEQLIVFLANNIGTVVKIGNIAREIKTTEKTVERYISILEKMFVIIKITSFSRNPNNELKNGFKIYFTDIGFRNSIIKNHSEMTIRNDRGALFENYVIIERIKYMDNHRIFVNRHFWQNYKQVEIDYIEESNGVLDVFECKYTERKTKSIPIFQEIYHNEINSITIITQDNYGDFLISNENIKTT
jgi:predicted AAA+ superfamily ATPase